ncbi:MAG TPA: hypothetical protein VLV48_10280 [Thermoanaerobaculia bacterium]|nr:hypothetical protein [Thermoanaerobaculia bacterium]
MSKNNVNPDHYKVAGRERQGEDVIAVEHKQRFGNIQHDLAARADQRSRSLEAMRAKQEQSARKAAPAAATPKKTAPKKKGSAASKAVASKAKKAVSPRPKRALSGKPKQASAGAARRATPSRKK